MPIVQVPHIVEVFPANQDSEPQTKRRGRQAKSLDQKLAECKEGNLSLVDQLFVEWLEQHGIEACPVTLLAASKLQKDFRESDKFREIDERRKAEAERRKAEAEAKKLDEFKAMAERLGFKLVPSE